jgi:uncharacterized membrane-anchored protein YhcB (DUF1043 family)
MKKFWAGFGLVLGVVIGAVVLFIERARLLEVAQGRVLKDLPKEVGIASEEYRKLVEDHFVKLASARQLEIAQRFKSAFGG